MREADSVPADTADHPVWQRLRSYQIGPPEAALSFSARLARENGWSAATAERVLEEYRRFAFLAVTGDTPATPSDAVDQAWHLHLSYTRDYWERFCPDVLGRALHHGPTAGGTEEHRRYYRQYADTLARYEATFGVLPPSDIWPSAARRLIEDPRARRVHPREAVIVPRWQAALYASMLIAMTVLALYLGVT
jgi:hypothetical protein